MFKWKLKLNEIAMSYICSAEKIRDIIESKEIKRSGNLNFISTSAVKIAAVSMPMKPYKNISEYIYQVDKIISEAVQTGAQVIAFPELCGMLPATLSPGFASIYGDLTRLEKNEGNHREAFLAVCESTLGYCGEIYLNTFSKLASSYGVIIVAGSIFCWESSKVKNRSFIFDETGKVAGSQDKIFISELEKKLGVIPGDKITPADTKAGRIGMFSADDCKHFEPFVLSSLDGVDICVATGTPWNSDCSLARYRAAESMTCIICPQYTDGEHFNFNFSQTPTIYAPLQSTPAKDGILKKAQPLQSAIARVDVIKVKSSYDVYNSDQNIDFYTLNFQ